MIHDYLHRAFYFALVQHSHYEKRLEAFSRRNLLRTPRLAELSLVSRHNMSYLSKLQTKVFIKRNFVGG